MKAKKSARFWVAVALIICLISSVGAMIVQTDGGSITIKELYLETESGLGLDALLLIPENATSDTPAPAIVTSHGWFNNKEMQDLNYLEYAKRGFVVVSISMYGHGDSEVIHGGTWWTPEHNANGMYDAVKLLASLPYVDASRIGVTGHSNGGLACKEAVRLDKLAETPLIASVLLVSCDPIYTEEDTVTNTFGRRVYDTSNDTYTNFFGNRDVGFIACEYDEFFNCVSNGDGTWTAAREYINTAPAQSFLHFGVDPAGLEMRQADTLYRQDVDGVEAIRVVYTPPIIHPGAHFSTEAVEYGVEFFEATLDGPIDLPGTSQTWTIKAAFNALGLIGIAMFLIYGTLAILDTRHFESLKAKQEVVPAPLVDKKAKLWYWGGFIATNLVSLLVYPAIYRWCVGALPKTMFWQLNTFYIGLWSLICAVASCLYTVIYYFAYGKKNGVDLKDRGVVMPVKDLAKSVFLGLVVVAATFGIVFVSDWLFLTDYRLWCLTVRAFDSFHLGEVWKYLIFFVPYYVMLSVSTNCFNFVEFGKEKKKGFVSAIIAAVMVAAAPAIMIAVQYIPLFATGYCFTEKATFGGSLIGLWLFPVVVILPFAALMSRKIYKQTKNPYIAGIVMGVFVTVMTATNQLCQPM